MTEPPPHLPKITQSPEELLTCHLAIAAMFGIPADRICMWAVIAVEHPEPDSSHLRHSPHFLPSSVDALEPLAYVTERCAEAMRAIITLDVPDFPPMVE